MKKPEEYLKAFVDMLRRFLPLVASFLYVLCRFLFQAIGWVILVHAVIQCGSRIFGFDIYGWIESMFFIGIGLLEKMIEVVQSVLELDLSFLVKFVIDLADKTVNVYASLVTETVKTHVIILAVGMYLFRFVQDILAKRKPLYLWPFELTAELASWMAKMVLSYVCFHLVFLGFSWLNDTDSLVGLPQTVKEVLDFLVLPVKDPLTTALGFVAVCVVCAAICRVIDYLHREKK